jgi:hypothetical protein
LGGHLTVSTGRDRQNAKLSPSTIKHHVMKTYGGVEAWLREFLTSALQRNEWSVSSNNRFNPWERAPVWYWIKDWRLGGPPEMVWTLEKNHLLILGIELRFLGRPADISVITSTALISTTAMRNQYACLLLIICHLPPNVFQSSVVSGNGSVTSETDLTAHTVRISILRTIELYCLCNTEHIGARWSILSSLRA